MFGCTYLNANAASLLHHPFVIAVSPSALVFLFSFTGMKEQQSLVTSMNQNKLRNESGNVAEEKHEWLGEKARRE